MTPERIESLVMQEEVFEGLNKRPAVYEAVRANVQKQQDKVRKRKLEQGWDDSFAVGDVVLKKTSGRIRERGVKWPQQCWGHLPLQT